MVPLKVVWYPYSRFRDTPGDVTLVQVGEPPLTAQKHAVRLPLESAQRAGARDSAVAWQSPMQHPVNMMRLPMESGHHAR